MIAIIIDYSQITLDSISNRILIKNTDSWRHVLALSLTAGLGK